MNPKDFAIKDLHQRLEFRKDDLIESLNKVLEEAGLHDIGITSMQFRLTNKLPRCPSGQPPVWVAIPQPDGSIIYELVCR
jgi:hypothetical protein